MVSDPASLSESTVRALSRELVEIRHELDTVKRGLRATQLGYSSVENGYLTFNDGSSQRLRVGRQPDGKFGWGAVNGDPPPRPEGIELVGTTSGVAFTWTGAFAGIAPSDLTYVNFYLSPSGASFVHDESNLVGKLIGAGTLPVTSLGGSTINAGLSYWGRAVAYNSSGVASEASFTFGPATPAPVVAAEVLQGIVDELALADNAVTNAKIAAAAVDGTKIAEDSIETPHLTAGSVTAEQIAAAQILAHHLTAGSVTAETIQALSILSDHIAANVINAGHIQAGSITADHLSAVLVLASKIIAGNPDDWHLELGDAQTPILYWNGEDTGFAVSKDAATGQANVYLSGRVEFGNGSQIEQDYLDLAEQANSGFQEPKVRQMRHWIDSGPKTSVTARWTSATQSGNLVLMAVFQTAASGSTPPNCGTPPGATIIDSQIQGAQRLTLFYVPNASSRSGETFGSSAGAARWAITLVEYSGITTATPLDVNAFASGTGTTAASGTTAATTQASELQFAVFGANIGFTNGKNGQWNNPTNGFTKILEGDGAAGTGIAVVTKAATATGAASTTVTPNKSVPWIGIIATFKTMPAAGVPPTPATGTLRMFSRSRAGYSTPHVIDNTGAIYPVGRSPYCRVYSTADFTVTASTDLWAQGNWAIAQDPYSMAAISTSGGTWSNITIPISGYYIVDYKAVFDSHNNVNNVVAVFVAKNARSNANSVARDVRNVTQKSSVDSSSLAPGDKSPAQATRVVPLTAGDVLYWGNWSNVNGMVVFAGLSNIPTEIVVTYLGPL